MDRKDRKQLVYSTLSTKMKKVFESYGALGFGVYIVLEEMLFRAENNRIKIGESLAQEFNNYREGFEITYEKLKPIIFDFELFDIESGYLSSRNLIMFGENGEILYPTSCQEGNGNSEEQQLLKDIITDLNNIEHLRELVKDRVNTFVNFAITERAEIGNRDIQQEVAKFLDIELTEGEKL